MTKFYQETLTVNKYNNYQLDITFEWLDRKKERRNRRNIYIKKYINKKKYDEHGESLCNYFF